MSKLIILSGPSGVGKNTLIDKVREELSLPYFRKVTTRDKRSDDRDEEAEFASKRKYDEMLKSYQIAIPYFLRDEWYGVLLKSLADLKENDCVSCFGDLNLIKVLSDCFHTTNVYVKSEPEQIIERLNAREDTPEQRAKSIAAMPKHLENYHNKYRSLFDYEITNGEDLKKAQNQLLEIVNKEIKYGK